jgi:peptidoglycan/LPS O-acetylase OafA/YrhL
MLGRYSYGIYIWHIFAAAVALDALPSGGPQAIPAVGQVVQYAAAIAVGVLATVAVEKPMLRLRDRLLPAQGHAATGHGAEEPASTATVPPTAPLTVPVRQERPACAVA